MIIAVDYDHTLDDAGYPFVGKPFLDRIEKIKKLREEGNEIILWTCRHGQALEAAIQYMKTFGLEFDAINENVKRYSNGTILSFTTILHRMTASINNIFDKPSVEHVIL